MPSPWSKDEHDKARLKQIQALARNRRTWFDWFQKILATLATLATLGIIAVAGIWFGLEEIVAGTVSGWGEFGGALVVSIGCAIATIAILRLIWRSEKGRSSR